MEKLIHLLIPRQSNNHKAKLLHNSSLFVIAIALLLVQGIFNYISKVKPGILGYSANISIAEIVRLTNQRRSEAGLSQLALNQNLSDAAYTKGRDMVDRDYWAHVSPEGTEPWSFFTRFGYKYRYAGENLARDFSSASSAVDAWMNSPTHRENMLNPKYKEIGIGVTEGDLAGVDTTIIVQFLGATYADKVVEPLAAVKTTAKVPVASPVVSPVPTSTPELNQQVLISPFTTTRTLYLIIIGILVVVFIVDAFLISRRRINRISGRTLAHVTFLLLILFIIILIRSGKII